MRLSIVSNLFKILSEEYTDKMQFILVAILLFVSVSSINTFASILTFKPLTAYTFEPRIGSSYNFNDNNLRLDIGASFDLIKFNEGKDNEMSFGADFFTFTRLRSEDNFKFPVETSDYFFGINYSAKFTIFNEHFESRIRVAHISSHLVDGYSNKGFFFKQPFVYSREFAEAHLASYIYLSNDSYIRPYLGIKEVFSTQPDDITELQGQLGSDILYKLSNNFEISGGLHLANGENTTNFNSQIGMNIKFLQNIGLFLGYYYYSGNSIHGMFYKDKINYSAIGFQIIYQ